MERVSGRYLQRLDDLVAVEGQEEEAGTDSLDQADGEVMGKLTYEGLRPASDPMHRQGTIVIGGLRRLKKNYGTASSRKKKTPPKK